MKVGDKLYCYNSNTNIHSGGIYIINNFDINALWLRNDYGLFDWYNISNKSSINYYGRWFYTLKELRKVKLDILRSSSLIERSFICEAIIGMEGLE